MILEDFIKSAKAILQYSNISSTPDLDVSLIVMHALNITREEILMKKTTLLLSQDDFKKCNSLLNRRIKNEPIAYIIGQKEFWNHVFLVNSAVLIPRPETEIIIEMVLKYYQNHEQTLMILDLGTGSGCIPLSLLSIYQNSKAVAVDISLDALEIANKNAINIGLQQNITFIQSDWFSSLEEKSYQSFDLITANPPYITRQEWQNLDANVKEYEPKIALTDSTDDGLLYYRKIFRDVSRYMKEEALIFLEFGKGQKDAIEKIAFTNGLIIKHVQSDLSHIPRTMILGKR